MGFDFIVGIDVVVFEVVATDDFVFGNQDGIDSGDITAVDGDIISVDQKFGHVIKRGVAVFVLDIASYSDVAGGMDDFDAVFIDGG